MKNTLKVIEEEVLEDLETLPVKENYIELKKEGKFITHYFDFNSLEDQIIHKQYEFKLRGHLIHLYKLSVENGATFESLCRALKPDLELWEAAIGMHITDFVNEALENEFEALEDVESIEIIHEIKIEKWEQDSKPEYNQCVYAHTVSNNPQDLSGCFMGVPAYTLKEYPIKLNTVLSLPIIDHSDFEEHLKNKREKYNSLKETILLQNKLFTPYEVISSIFFELSWYGSPDEREKEMEEMKKNSSEDETYLIERSQKGNIDRFKELLNKVPGTTPMPGDEKI